MRHRVRCTDCLHCPPRMNGRCNATGYGHRGNAYWRKCEAYSPLYPPPDIEDVWQELLDTGLDYFVDKLADIGNGQRMLRLKAGVEADERFKVYQAIGLRVDEPSVIHTDNRHEVKRQGNANGQAYQGETVA